MGGLEAVEQQSIEELDGANQKSASEIVDRILLEETGYGGFMGYVIVTIREGVSIHRVSRGNLHSFRSVSILCLLGNRGHFVKHVALLKVKDYSRLGEMFGEYADLPSFDVYIEGCLKCQSNENKVIVRRSTRGTRGKVQFQEIYETTINSIQRTELMRQLGLLQ